MKFFWLEIFHETFREIYLKYFKKVLSHFIMKIKNFMKYFKEGVSKYLKISVKFLNISK